MQYYIKPLERLKDEHDDSIVNKVHDYLHVDDNDIFNDPYEKDDGFDFDNSYSGNYASLPPTVDTIRLFSQSSNNDNTISQPEEQDQENREDYISTIRKTRPLPKIPDRSSSKEISKDMTLILTESLKNQNRVSAQQLFQMLSKSKLTQDEEKPDEEQQQQNPHNESDVGGVYALKTQVSTLRLSNKEILKEYYQFECPSKKLMTPVEEVDEEDQDFFNEDSQRSNRSSFSAPSLTSGQSSPASSRKSLDITNTSGYSNVNSITNLSNGCSQQSEQSTDMVSDNEGNSDEENDFTSPYQSFKHGRAMPNSRQSLSSDSNISSENSLFADVHRLSQQNHMLTNTSNVSLPTTYSAAVDTNGHSEFSITSSGITHDKEAIKTFRRMATKTNDRHIQFNYAKHLIKLVSMYTSNGALDSEAIATRTRLQEEAEYWIEKLAKSNYASALYIKGQWHRQCGDKRFKDIFVSYKKVDHDKAFKCFQQAAKYGSVEAYYELAEYWMVRKDYKKSVSFYKYAASKNHIPSLYVRILNVSDKY